MQYLSTLELEERGDMSGLVTKDENGAPNLLAFVWMDRDRRYFIASASSLTAGKPYTQYRWHQIC